MTETANKSQKFRLNGKMKNYLNVLFSLTIAGIVTTFALGLTVSAPLAGGSISVTVKYKGAAPKVSVFKVTKDQSVCHSTVENETLIVGSGNGIKNTMIYVKGATGSVTPKDYVLDNEGCKFVPHAGFATKGSKLVMKNSDEVMHNTHGYFVKGKMKKTIVNNALPKKGSTINNTKALSKPGLVSVKCDAHEWMSATIIVVDNPYHAVTDANGKATIKNVPPGTYDLVFYHESLGEIIKKVVVEDGKTATVSVEMSK